MVIRPYDKTWFKKKKSFWGRISKNFLDLAGFVKNLRQIEKKIIK